MKEKKPKTTTPSPSAVKELIDTPTPQKPKPTHQQMIAQLIKRLARKLPDYSQALSKIADEVETGKTRLIKGSTFGQSLIGATIVTPYGEGVVTQRIGGWFKVQLSNPSPEGPQVVFVSRKIEKK